MRQPYNPDRDQIEKGKGDDDDHQRAAAQPQIEHPTFPRWARLNRNRGLPAASSQSNSYGDKVVGIERLLHHLRLLWPEWGVMDRRADLPAVPADPLRSGSQKKIPSSQRLRPTAFKAGATSVRRVLRRYHLLQCLLGDARAGP